MGRKKSEQKFLNAQMWDTFERIAMRTKTDIKKLQKMNPTIKQGFMRFNQKVRYK